MQIPRFDCEKYMAFSHLDIVVQKLFILFFLNSPVFITGETAVTCQVLDILRSTYFTDLPHASHSARARTEGNGPAVSKAPSCFFEIGAEWCIAGEPKGISVSICKIFMFHKHHIKSSK